MNIYAVPTLNQESIERPELALIFNSDSDSDCSTKINQIVLGTFNDLISKDQLNADGFNVFMRGYDNQEIPIYSLPLVNDLEIQRPSVVPFACDRYLSIDASYIEELTKKTQHKINYMSPLAFVTQELSFDSMDDYINYNKKQRTVAAWLELLSESQAFILGEYQAIKLLLAQVPNITYENFKTTEVLPFTADNVHYHINEIFMSNFVIHELIANCNSALVKHETKRICELKYDLILKDGEIDQDALKMVFSNLKTMLQVSESSNKNLTEINQKIFKLHQQFFKAVDHQLIGNTISIFDDQVVLTLDSHGSFTFRLQHKFLVNFCVHNVRG